MGNSFCTCDLNSNYLCDSNPLSKRDDTSNIPKFQIMENELIKPYLRVDGNDLETKVSMRYIESYKSFGFFPPLIRSIIVIQRNYRLFIQKKMAIKNSPIGATTNQVVSSIISQNDNDSNLIVNIETQSMKPIEKNKSRHDFSKKTSLLSNYSFNSHKTNNSLLDNRKIKGYFLRKKIKYRYKGYLNDKKKDGFGIVTWEDGSQFKAKFGHNKSKGICKYIDASKSTFYGVYDNNRPNGYGIYEEDNIQYEGIWTNNILNGIGIEIWKKDMTFYRGQYVNSIKEGIGFCGWEDGTIYQGEWKNNKMNGYGMIFYPDERIYIGQIKNDVIDGFGEFNWPDHKKYIGEYVNEKKEGFGIFIWSFEPLIAYAGFWYNGKQNGIGASINNDKVRFFLWKNGRKDNCVKDQWDIEKNLKKECLNHWGLFKLNEKEMIKKINTFVPK